MHRLNNLRKKINFSARNFTSWAEERAPYGRKAIIEGISEILKAIGRFLRD